jgi:dephospho-CoA kinase
MLKIGLTGGIGSGKSTIAWFFEELGVPIYSADARAKTLQNQEPLKTQIQALFKGCVYFDNQLDRKKVAELVFNNRELLSKLNALVHPAVAADFDQWLSGQKSPYIIKEAAIIFEIGNEKNYDKIILVTAPEAVRIARVIARDNSKKEDVEARIANQLSDEIKKQKADFVIDNLSLEASKNQVLALHKRLLNEG